MNLALWGFALAMGVFVTTSPGLAETGQERPILVRVRDLLKPYLPDGTALNDVGDYFAPSWAPDGTRFLALVPQTAPNESFSFPAVFDRTGSWRYLFPELPEGTYLYRPIWSPDGHSVALIRYGPSGFAFVVVDAETAEIIAEGEIPDKFTAGFPYYTAGIDTFAWSPDSKKIIFSWEGVLVFDVVAKKVQVASNDFALAFWSSDSGGVCMLQYEREWPNPIVLGYLRRFELETGILHDIASPEGLAGAGIDLSKSYYMGNIRLSPDGSSVAFNMGNPVDEISAIRIYDASPDCVKNLIRPRRVIETNMVPVMEWAPDGTAIAVIEQVQSPGPEFGFEARVIDLETGERTTLVGFELEGLELDIFGLVSVLAWSR